MKHKRLVKYASGVLGVICIAVIIGLFLASRPTLDKATHLYQSGKYTEAQKMYLKLLSSEKDESKKAQLDNQIYLTYVHGKDINNQYKYLQAALESYKKANIKEKVILLTPRVNQLKHEIDVQKSIEAIKNAKPIGDLPGDTVR